MVQYGEGSSSETYQEPTYAAGKKPVKQVARRYINAASPAVFEGDLTSPFISNVFNLAKREGDKKVGQLMEELASSSLSDPDKADKYAKLQNLAIQSSVGAPIEAWKQANEVLLAMLKASGSKGYSTSTGGSSYGIGVGGSGGAAMTAALGPTTTPAG